jgi:hypothetical protein
MSQVLGGYGLLDFTIFSLGAHFETYEPFISLIFQFFGGGGRSKPRIKRSACKQAGRQADGWMDGWMDRQTDRQTDIIVVIFVQ